MQHASTVQHDCHTGQDKHDADHDIALALDVALARVDVVHVVHHRLHYSSSRRRISRSWSVEKASRASPPSSCALMAFTTSSGRASSSQTTSAAVTALPSAASSAAVIAALRVIMASPDSSQVRLREQAPAWTGLSVNGGRAPANDGCGPAVTTPGEVQPAKSRTRMATWSRPGAPRRSGDCWSKGHAEIET